MAKLSRYNHFQPWRDGQYLAYNARSGAVAIMTAENFAVMKRLTAKLENGGKDNLDQEEHDLLRQMEYGKFACPESFDELEFLKFRHRIDRYNLTSMGLVLAPTMACNMDCLYCYEAKTATRMTPEVQEALVQLVRRQAGHLETLDVNWYGGEPLLATDIIEELSGEFLKLADEYSFRYVGSMISNGYLLTPETVDMLVANHVYTIQTTLDGPARTHDKRRPLKTGASSFDTIVRNITYAATKMGITVRVNVGKDFTPGMVEELLEELAAHDLQDRVTVYFGQLESATNVCANIAESCFDTGEFAKVEADYHRLLIDHGFHIGRLPSPISTQCSAQMVNAFIVDPDGDVYNCFNYIGDKSMAYANVTERIDYQHPNFVRLFSFDALEDETCRSCSVLPICMGGCPARRADRGLTGDQRCESWKHNLQPMLDVIACSKFQEQQRAATEKEKV